MKSSPAFILLPLITYVLLVLLFARRGSPLNALGKSHIVFFGFIAVSTEFLSAFHWIDFPHLLGIWGCLGCVLAVAFRKRPGFSSIEKFPRISPVSILLLGTIVFILAATFATAILYPPNNWDSMTYHMARVPNWISNRSVSFYPTAIERQNFSAPLAEFAIMHLQLLSGSDLFANLVQWTCFVVSIALGALIAAELSLNRREQLMSAVIIATIPMAILQSTSTQNDLVVSSFILAFALFMLRLGKDFNIENILFASLSLGLALLTKGTAYIYCAPLGVALAVPILFKARSNFSLLIRRAGCLSLVCLIALALNSGHFARSYRLYGSPVYGGPGWLNQDSSISALLSNIPKNLSLHLGTRSRHINEVIDETLRSVLGKQLDNRDNNYLGIPFRIVPYRRHEDYAGNPIHLWLTLLAFALAFVWARRQFSQRNWYAIALLLGGCLYCFCIKWQPWASRVHTPLFALAAPVIVIALTQHAKGIGRYSALAGIAFMVLYSFPFALNNQTRSLLSNDWKQKERMQLYFTNRPELYEPYKRAMNVLEKAGAQDVGLYIGGDGWEYPFWVFAKSGDMRFRHVGLTEQSKVLQTEASLPAYVVATMNTDTWPERKEYSPVYASDNVSVLKRLGHESMR